MLPAEKPFSYFISCPKGLELLLEQEIARFSLVLKKQTLGGVYCEGALEAIYSFIIYTRLANRVILVLDTLSVAKETSKASLFHSLTDIPFSACFSFNQSFSVEFRGTNRLIQHSHYGALWIKDAVSDHFQENLGERPSVDRDTPDVRIFAQIKKTGLLIGIDLANGSLHKRGYRLEGAKAPLKENVAAALAMRAGVKEGELGPLVDPFCGSATLLIEAMSIQLGLVAQLKDESFGIHQLKMTRNGQLDEIKNQALAKHQASLSKTGVLAFGMDEDQNVIAQAKANIERAGLSDFISIKQQAIKDFQNTSLIESMPEGGSPPLLLTNPPYGERIGEKQRLFATYQDFGRICRDECQGFDIAVLSSDETLSKALGLQKSKSYQFYNGAIKVSWTLYHIHQKTPEQLEKTRQLEEKFQQGVEMVSNRLMKNQKRLKKWINRERIDAYRLYDADMPEYAFALDVYGEFFQVTEYQAPKTVDEFAVTQRRQQFIAAVKSVFALKNDNKIIMKTRKKQKGFAQYEKMDQQQHFFPVKEGNIKALVNLTDYLDTGLFLDHRPVRRFIAEQSRGKHFLNLFAYTSVATLHAAASGAESSLSVDMSNTYQSWSLRNFRANGLDLKKHRLLNVNVMDFIKTSRESFDLIFLDPPSFSNSKKMRGSFDIQRDHRFLIEQTMGRLNEGGTLIFSNNLRGFILDDKITNRYKIIDFHQQSIDPDFAKRANIHNCWLIQH